jgi:hypothetical protein
MKTKKSLHLPPFECQGLSQEPEGKTAQQLVPNLRNVLRKHGDNSILRLGAHTSLLPTPTPIKMTGFSLEVRIIDLSFLPTLTNIPGL